MPSSKINILSILLYLFIVATNLSYHWVALILLWVPRASNPRPTTMRAETKVFQARKRDLGSSTLQCYLNCAFCRFLSTNIIFFKNIINTFITKDVLQTKNWYVYGIAHTAKTELKLLFNIKVIVLNSFEWLHYSSWIHLLTYFDIYAFEGLPANMS